MALLTAYLDESENATEDGGTRVFAIGGYVAFPHHFDGLASRWQAIVDGRLKPIGIDRFHMSPFESSKGGFERLAETEQHKLLRDLMDIIHGCEIQPVAVVLDMEDWHRLPEVTRSRMETPFYPMMQAIVRLIAENVKTSDDDPRVQFIFDTREDVVRECTRAYELMKGELPQLVGVPAFLPCMHVPELQAADIVAYEACKDYRNRLAGGSRVRVSTRMLVEKRNLWRHIISLGAKS
jgi:hypothetical protein